MRKTDVCMNDAMEVARLSHDLGKVPSHQILVYFNVIMGSMRYEETIGSPAVDDSQPNEIMFAIDHPVTAEEVADTAAEQYRLKNRTERMNNAHGRPYRLKRYANIYKMPVVLPDPYAGFGHAQFDPFNEKQMRHSHALSDDLDYTDYFSSDEEEDRGELTDDDLPDFLSDMDDFDDDDDDE